MGKQSLILEGILQDETVVYTLVELSEICVIEPPILHEMIEYGIIEPQIQSGPHYFNYRALYRAQKALRLQRDLAINWEGISLVLDLLDEIEDLRQKLNQDK